MELLPTTLSWRRGNNSRSFKRTETESEEEVSHKEILPYYFIENDHIRKSVPSKLQPKLERATSEANHKVLTENNRQVHEKSKLKTITGRFAATLQLTHSIVSPKEAERRGVQKVGHRIREELEMVKPRRDGTVTLDRDTVQPDSGEQTTNPPFPIFPAGDAELRELEITEKIIV